MGKKSKKPSYTSGSVTINGQKVATVTKDKNGFIQSTYNMSAADKAIYNNVQKNLNDSINNLFNISDSTKNQWMQQLEKYKQNGIEEINSIYDPMQTSLKNDIAGRFGNLDNSVFLDKLSAITDNKAKAVSSLSDSIVMKQNELYSTELSNRMNYISLLNGIYNGYNNQTLNYTNLALANADSGNNYNTKTYSNNSGSSFLSSMASLASTASSLYF